MNEASQQTYQQIAPLLACPLCGGGLSLSHGSLLCENNHCYDVSKRGHVNFVPGQRPTKYTKELFLARRAVFEAGFYGPVVEHVRALAQAQLPASPTVLDAGCGEGFFLHALHGALNPAAAIGLDIEKQAVQLAAGRSRQIAWLAGDVNRLPVKAGCIQLLLNILTPANYEGFRRVLAPGGLLVKIVPGPDYLSQVRKALKGDDASPGSDAQALFAKALGKTMAERLHYTLPLDPAQAAAFMHMTPLSFGAEQSSQSALPSEITIDLIVLAGQARS